MISRFDFFKWQAKAPVDIPGAQRIAKKIWPKLKEHLTLEERDAVSIAIGHALIGEGRGEFDLIADKIKDRLFGGDRL